LFSRSCLKTTYNVRFLLYSPVKQANGFESCFLSIMAAGILDSSEFLEAFHQIRVKVVPLLSFTS
jgi:hypothetical protein